MESKNPNIIIKESIRTYIPPPPMIRSKTESSSQTELSTPRQIEARQFDDFIDSEKEVIPKDSIYLTNKIKPKPMAPTKLQTVRSQIGNSESSNESSGETIPSDKNLAQRSPSEEVLTPINNYPGVSMFPKHETPTQISSTNLHHTRPHIPEDKREIINLIDINLEKMNLDFEIELNQLTKMFPEVPDEDISQNDLIKMVENAFDYMMFDDASSTQMNFFSLNLNSLLKPENDIAGKKQNDDAPLNLEVRQKSISDMTQNFANVMLPKSPVDSCNGDINSERNSLVSEPNGGLKSGPTIVRRSQVPAGDLKNATTIVRRPSRDVETELKYSTTIVKKRVTTEIEKKSRDSTVIQADNDAKDPKFHNNAPPNLADKNYTSKEESTQEDNPMDGKDIHKSLILEPNFRPNHSRSNLKQAANEFIRAIQTKKFSVDQAFNAFDSSGKLASGISPAGYENRNVLNPLRITTLNQEFSEANASGSSANSPQFLDSSLKEVLDSTHVVPQPTIFKIPPHPPRKNPKALTISPIQILLASAKENNLSASDSSGNPQYTETSQLHSTKATPILALSPFRGFFQTMGGRNAGETKKGVKEHSSFPWSDEPPTEQDDSYLTSNFIGLNDAPVSAMIPQEAPFKRKNAILDSRRKNSLIPSSTFKKMEPDAETSALLARCIIVFDVNNNPHAIDLHNIFNDAKAIREKILAKFTIGMGATKDLDYELYIRAKSFDSTRFIRDTSIDDLTLLEICSSPDHPYRSQIEFDKKRHPRVIANSFENKSRVRQKRGKYKERRDSVEDGEIQDKLGDEDEGKSKKLSKFFGLNDMNAAPQKEQRTGKLKDFFGEDGDTKLKSNAIKARQKRRIRKPKKTDLEENAEGSKINILDDMENVGDEDFPRKNVSKLKDFFGENVSPQSDIKQLSKKISKKEDKRFEKVAQAIPLNDLPPAAPQEEENWGESVASSKKSGKKLETFFGDRPPQDLIAKNLETFFPGLQAIQEAFFNGAFNKQGLLKDKIQQTAQSKRTSLMQQSKSLAEKRKLQIANSKSQLVLIDENLSYGSQKSLETEDLRLSTTTLSKYDNTDVMHDLATTQDSQIHSLKRPDILSHVEGLLNIPPSQHVTFDLLGAFAVDPDTPKGINWAQGPLIGMGSFGKVFYGANCETGEIMAVKQILINPPGVDQKTKTKMLEALHLEISLLKNLNHPNIVGYLGYYTEKEVINVFLEYVSGGSVTSALNLMGAFDEMLIQILVIQVLQGLDYLHECRLIHRDIKGGNILIDDDGIAKISDFGISKKNCKCNFFLSLVHELPYDNNSVMSVQGTVYWMAPEVLKGNGYSAKVDIWSLGGVVVEMFTGKHPWQNLDEIQTLWRLGRFDKPPLPIGISVAAKNFLESTFTINPKERPCASVLLNHEFCLVNVEDFDFRAYKIMAIIKKQQLDADDEYDSSDEDDSEEESEEDDEMEEDL